MIPTTVGGDSLGIATMSFASSTAMTSASHETAYIGQVPRSGTISSIGVRFGAVTKGATTAMQVSLQDVDLTAGPPGRRDGTVDQSGTIGNAAIVANTWATATLSTSRTVTVGDLIAVVVKFDTFVAADSIAMSQISATVVPRSTHVATTTDGTTWTTANNIPNLILGYSSGNNGTLVGALGATAITTSAYNSGSTPDERGSLWVPSVSMRVAGLMAVMVPSGDFDMVLYDSAGTALATASVDANTVRVATQGTFARYFATPVDVVAGNTYYMTVKPTTTTNVTLYSFTLNSANDRDAWPMGVDVSSATRTNAGSWTTSTTTVVSIVPIIDPQPASGGLVIHPGMSGGMRG